MAIGVKFRAEQWDEFKEWMIEEVTKAATEEDSIDGDILNFRGDMIIERQRYNNVEEGEALFVAVDICTG